MINFNYLPIIEFHLEINRYKFDYSKKKNIFYMFIRRTVNYYGNNLNLIFIEIFNDKIGS
jgi:hypothetical protein